MLEVNNKTNTSDYLYVVEKKSRTLRVYSILIFFVTILTVLQSFVLFHYTMRASVRIHKKAFSNIVQATMNFFDLNLSGNVLNRFSRDTANVDETIPFHIYGCIRTTFILFGVLIIISSTNKYFLLVSAFFMCLLYCIKLFHMPTARSLRRLDSSTRSPLVGHINASLEGIVTIRASGAEEILKAQFDAHQDLHGSASYMYMTFSRAFGFFLDSVNAFFAAAIIVTFLLFSTGTLSGTVGLAITQIFSLTGVLQWGLRQWAELENQMTSVERINEYATVETEDEKGESPKNWPSEGKIVYESVELTYARSKEPVLRDISFKVEPKEKIGIIGRTGAGKSTIIATLFKLYKIKGSVYIDDVDISTVNIEYLRKHISIIPQEPIMFTGTVRTNLDPYGEHADSELWSVLKEVELKNLVECLDNPINDCGSDFSVGQRQLLCLARAILRNNKVLVLDEATANVDPETDAFIQEKIKTRFASCTVLTIAHRLETVLTLDKVMVMAKGCIKEFDAPQNLLKNENGIFYNMVKQAGLLQNKDKNT